MKSKCLSSLSRWIFVRSLRQCKWEWLVIWVYRKGPAFQDSLKVLDGWVNGKKFSVVNWIRLLSVWELPREEAKRDPGTIRATLIGRSTDRSIRGICIESKQLCGRGSRSDLCSCYAERPCQPRMSKLGLPFSRWTLLACPWAAPVAQKRVEYNDGSSLPCPRNAEVVKSP